MLWRDLFFKSHTKVPLRTSLNWFLFLLPLRRHIRVSCVYCFVYKRKLTTAAYLRICVFAFDGFSINSIENLTNLGALNSSIYSCCGLGLSHSLIFLCLLFVCVCSLPSSQLICVGRVCAFAMTVWLYARNYSSPLRLFIYCIEEIYVCVVHLCTQL